MSGTDIIAELLLAAPDRPAGLPDGNIKEDRLPDGVKLPAIVLESVSTVIRQELAPDEFVRVTERVSVTVRANSSRERKAIIGWAWRACKDRTGTIADMPRTSVLDAGRGPAGAGPNASYQQTQDFRVSFDAPV